MDSWPHTRGICPAVREPIMGRLRHRQRDLFEEPMAPTALPADLRTKLSALLQELLAEAAGVEPAWTNPGELDSREDGDDQDHA
jgi:hypothetical protein